MKSFSGRLPLVAGAVVLAFGCSSDDITNTQTTLAGGGPQFTITAPGDTWTAGDNHKAFVCVVSPFAGTYTFDISGSPAGGSSNPGPTILVDPADVAPGTCVHVATAGTGANFPYPDNVTADETAHPAGVMLSGVTVEQAIFNSQSGPFVKSDTADVNDPASGIVSNEQAVRFVFTYTEIPDEGGTEGCTPGYWKQKQHFDSWVGYTPVQTLESVFDMPDAFGMDNLSLVDALGLPGGPGSLGAARILMRAAVAALLNSGAVDYTMSTAEVIAAVNAALATNDRDTMLGLASSLDSDNNLGCPLN